MIFSFFIFFPVNDKMLMQHEQDLRIEGKNKLVNYYTPKHML